MFNSLVFPHVAPPDKHIVTAVLGGAQAGQGELPIGEIERGLPELARKYLGVRDAFVMGVRAWNRAIPQLNVGHHAVVAEMDRLEAENPGIIIASVDRGAVGASDRVRIARESVARLVNTASEATGQPRESSGSSV
jgi:protoporphyrinogen oxidase